MRLKLCLVLANDETIDVLVTADATATVGDVATSMAKSMPSWAVSGEARPNRGVTLRVQPLGHDAFTVLPADRLLGECPIESGCAVALVELGTAGADATLDDAIAELRVLRGQDRGRRFTVTGAGALIGRSAEAGVQLSDPLVSKRHARVEVEPDAIRVIDLNSANGLLLDGALVSRVSLRAGGVLGIGASLLQLDTVMPGPGRARAPGPQPTSAFTRSPRFEPRYRGERHALPVPPKQPEPQGVPWPVMIAPLILGAVLLFVSRNPLSIAFVALSPIMMLANQLSTRLSARARLRRQLREFESELARLEERLLADQDEERAARGHESPSSHEVVRAVEHRAPLMWCRRPENQNFLNVALGVGRCRSRTEIDELPRGEAVAPGLHRLARSFVERYRHIDGVPVTAHLPSVGGIGVISADSSGIEYLHGLIAQLIGMHAPSELMLTAIVPPEQSVEFDWLKWTPHATAAADALGVPVLVTGQAQGAQLLDRLEALVSKRSGGSGPETRLPAILVVIVDPVPADRGRLIRLLERGTSHGVLAMWLAPQLAALPAVCQSYIELDEVGRDQARVVSVREGERIAPVRPQLITAQRARHFARALAPVVESAAPEAESGQLPDSVMLLDLLGHELAIDPHAVIDRWHQNESILDARHPKPRTRGGTLRALVGQTGTAAMRLDLRREGPHALVGGTTGSGKSEFLQAWVLGMAAEYSPDQVSYLFIDYKGGAAFADCVRLPHAVGLVTDLNPHLVRRVLTSLGAEIRHRERLLNQKQAKDLVELELRGDTECPPVLVLVIDEFAALAAEIPEFIDGVVDIAQRGRSLGIHLIMATQRPAGVIRENLRANTNLRVALRMADESDSRDVVGDAMAAHFDPDLPGRAVVKAGASGLRSFQVGYAGDRATAPLDNAERVRLEGLGLGPQPRWAPARSSVDTTPAFGPGDLARLVDTFSAAAKLAGIARPRQPWLDELADSYDLARLSPPVGEGYAIGVCDDPRHQSQVPSAFVPDLDGNIGYFGAGGSGKTTALRSLAIAAAGRWRDDPVHIYGLDFASGGLRMLESLPQVGSIITADDDERIERLFAELARMLEQRVRRFAGLRATTLAEYRRLASRPDEPRVLLLVDGLSAFRHEHELRAGSQVFAKFQQLLVDGRGVGMHLAVTAERPGAVSAAVMAGLQKRVVLRMTDDADYAMFGAPSGVIGTGSPPGRALIDGLEHQLAVAGGSPLAHEQFAALESLIAAMGVARASVCPPIRRLEDRIMHHELRPAGAMRLTLGIADDTLEEVSIACEGVFIVAGPPSSGRSTALHTIASALETACPRASAYRFGDGRSRLPAARRWQGAAAGPRDARELAKQLLEAADSEAREGHRLIVVIESVAEYIGTEAEGELAALVRTLRRNGHFVIAEAETSVWASSWPLLTVCKSGRRGLLLQPDATDGQLLLKTSLPRFVAATMPPGRGYLIESGRARKIQMALTAGESPERPDPESRSI